MFKMLSKILFLLFVGFAAFVAQAQEDLPELKPSAIVDDSVITLGDIFSGLNEEQDLIVANAPDPGKKILVSARQILTLTRANNVRWRNSAGVKNILVSRASSIVNYTDLTPALTAELKNLYHSDRNLEIRFYNRNGVINLPTGFDAADIDIKNITLDKRSDKFSALVGAPTGNGGETLYTISGRTISVVRVPALTKTIRNGDIITKQDIKWISLPETQIGSNIIRNTENLVGLTPRNQIKEDTIIRLGEVSAPILVKRGELVKINFTTDKISLSTVGKALESGGKGDVIQVKNNSSQKIVTAIVFGPSLVEVHTELDNLVLLNNP
ncbi:MAG: flagellar basal body P-ring formation protein FlgA [Alphaproteobacteria bacterium]|nr:flagellar basal body P-ring formation protein FlgA [Alphaproteobacteria bacterium]HPF47515.1 flagellar basal body P-ring formation chaperone FlgA [Emcibacteraceae bacterium]